MASYNTSFNTSKLKLAHINIHSCRNTEMEISLFLKENDIDILALNETWLKSKFKLVIPNYIIRAMIDQEGTGEVSLSLIILISISLTRARQLTLIMKPLLFS